VPLTAAPQAVQPSTVFPSTVQQDTVRPSSEKAYERRTIRNKNQREEEPVGARAPRIAHPAVHESDSGPPPSAEHPAVAAYRAAFGRSPTARQATAIAAAITDITRWTRVLDDWHANAWLAESVGKMLDRYHHQDQEYRHAPPAYHDAAGHAGRPSAAPTPEELAHFLTGRDQAEVSPVSEDTCPECAGAGYYTLAVPIGHPDFGTLLPCACRIRTREQRAQQQAAQRAQALPAELARTLGRLAQARFDTFDRQRPLVELVWSGATFPIDVQRQALAQALEDAQHYAAQHSGWLYLCGPCGAGKSHLAAAIAHTVATSGQGVTYASVPDLLRFVRRGFGERSADERLDTLMAIDVLILDDLGAEHLTAWATEQLFVLLNARYLADRATVLTSNDRPEALPARLQSRVAELAQLFWMPISDYRQLRVGG